MSELRWQKSSFSGEGNNCLEIAAAREGARFLRESEEPGAVVVTTSATLRGFLVAVRAGRLDEVEGRR